MSYLLPQLPRVGDGSDFAHIDADGRPLCGAELGAVYAVSGWLYAYEICPACGKRQGSGQMGLFEGQVEEDKK